MCGVKGAVRSSMTELCNLFQQTALVFNGTVTLWLSLSCYHELMKLPTNNEQTVNRPLVRRPGNKV